MDDTAKTSVEVWLCPCVRGKVNLEAHIPRRGDAAIQGTEVLNRMGHNNRIRCGDTRDRSAESDGTQQPRHVEAYGYRQKRAWFSFSCCSATQLAAAAHAPGAVATKATVDSRGEIFTSTGGNSLIQPCVLPCHGLRSE